MTFTKAEAVERIRRAADGVPADALGKRDVLEQIAAMQAESVALMRAVVADEQDHAKPRPAWMRAGQMAQHFGVSKPQILDWMAPLVAAGEVRVIVPKSLEGKPGYTRYSVEDAERAWMVQPRAGKQ